jgi:cullin 1
MQSTRCCCTEQLSKNVHAQPKLLKEVEQEVLSNHQQALLQKEHSGCAALLRDDKV